MTEIETLRKVLVTHTQKTKQTKKDNDYFKENKNVTPERKSNCVILYVSIRNIIYTVKIIETLKFNQQ